MKAAIGSSDWWRDTTEVGVGIRQLVGRYTAMSIRRATCKKQEKNQYNLHTSKYNMSHVQYVY